MRKTIAIAISMIFTLALQAQGLIGAWEANNTTKNGDQLKHILTFTEDFYVSTFYKATSGEFVSTNGGKYSFEDSILTEHIEFHTAKPEVVGTELKHKFSIKDDELEFIESGQVFKKIDDGAPGKLQGAWLMSGRIRDGETLLRDTSRPRKTMKILSGTRFQWIAYNTETKEFKGTGGGTYTTSNGTYVEHIKFFSKDNSRVGDSLQFKYELVDGNWHHTGLSSKGDPIHEIWSARGK